jgi:hypothetical protein
MKKVNLIVILSLVFISCSKSDDTNQSFEINGRFKHQISGCNNGGNLEINCVEFIEFIDNSTVDVLIGGGDNVVRTKYHLNKNKIEFEPIGGLNFDISFKIQNDSTLNRIQDDGIWLKTE